MGIILQVENDFNGIRIDRFIGKKLNLTHSIICKLLRDKKKLVNYKISKELKARWKEIKVELQKNGKL